MAETTKIRYSDDGRTLERFSPESEETVFIVLETVENIVDEAFLSCRNLKKVGGVLIVRKISLKLKTVAS